MTESRGFKFVTTTVSVFKKIEKDDKIKYYTFYSSSKAEIIINETDIDDVFQSIYTTIISNMQNFQEKVQAGIRFRFRNQIIDSVIDSFINPSLIVINPLAGSRYIKLIKELDHPGRGLINIQKIDDNECLKQSIVRY